MTRKKNSQRNKFSLFNRRPTNNQKKKSLAEKLRLSNDIANFIYAIILLLLAIFFLGAAFGFSGSIGEWFFRNLKLFAGAGYYLIPVLFLTLAVSFFKNLENNFTKIKFFASFLFIISGLGLTELIFGEGGWIGLQVVKIQSFLDKGMTGILLLVFLVISLVVIFNSIPKFLQRKNKMYQDKLTKEEENKIDKIAGKVEKTSETEDNPKTKSLFTKKSGEDESKKMADKIKARLNMFGDKVILPPLKLLSKDSGKPSAGNIKANANIIKNTLASFGISVEMVDISVGPTVTRYSLKPAQGVRLSKIATLSDDLALALASKSILIQTPIPGQSLVGIEIPNRDKTLVGARTLFSSTEFVDSDSVLPLGIGKDILGETKIVGLEKTPHMLIAGATGAGKSVTIHAIINSLLYKHGPDTLKLLMIDPKRVELTLYNGLPHLLTPVVIDPKKAILVLRWAINEMNRRYEVLEQNKIRDISSYHNSIYQKAKDQGVSAEEMPEAMPYIVIVVDELAAIMQQYPKELETGIVSIAQKARAVGIHLILSTQRPSVNVVTGLIKANIPTRLALQVSSIVDSKTILDMKGAENLIGKGDMLYMTGDMPKPVRIQSAFISEEEVKAVVKFIKRAYRDELGETLDFSNDNKDKQAIEVQQHDIDLDSEDLEDQDELLSAAQEEVMTSGKASTSYLQRKFAIGYARAAKLIDILEEKGVIGPANGSKPREVLINNNDEEN